MMKLIFLCLTVLLNIEVSAKEKICLNMIVKDEKDVIRRSLGSAKPLFDYWVIVDTGSTDGTQEVIKEFLKDIPGELHERPWVDFAYNRTEAFELAKNHGDYILFLDADDWFEYPPDYHFPPLTEDQYQIWSGTKELVYIKPHVVKASLPWKFVGVTHEYLACDQNTTFAILSDIRRYTGSDGARAKDPKKFLKNVDLLTQGLKDEPNNSRYVFYLAESYKDSGLPTEALEWYQKRIQMGEWQEEVFWSMLVSSYLLRNLGFSEKCILENNKAAHRYSPHKAEPIYFIAEYYNDHMDAHTAYDFLKSIKMQYLSKGDLFNLDWIYDYGLVCQLGIAAQNSGRYAEALDIYNTLLTKDNLSPSWRTALENNRKFTIQRLYELSLGGKENTFQAGEHAQSN